MAKTVYILIGYPQYVFIDKICYRKAHITKNMQYRKQREIKISTKNNVKGFWLVKNKKRAFIPLTKLRHRLK